MPTDAKNALLSLAKELGFEECRVAPATAAPHADNFLKWLEEGKHGEMAWMEKTPHRRCDPREVLPGCKAVISLILNYFPGQDQPNPDYRIARYSWNEDYHLIIEKKLKALNLLLQEHGGTQRFYVDYGPVLERDFATLSGNGWNGKSTVQIHPKHGCYFFLAELLTTLPLEPDPPMRDYCGKCTACIDACPTGAITAPHQLDARKCISYWTIEHPDSIPEEYRHAIGDRLYGCDECLEACPWNRFAKVARETRFHAREEIFRHKLRDFLAFDDDTFRKVFRKSPVKRLKLSRFLRNVCVVLGNKGSSKDLFELEKATKHPDPVVVEHAQWAMRKIEYNK